MTPELSHEDIRDHAVDAIDRDRAALPFNSFAVFAPMYSRPRPLTMLFEQLYVDKAHGVRLHNVDESNRYLEEVIHPPANPTYVTIPRQGHDYPEGSCEYSETGFDFARRQLYEQISEFSSHSMLSVYHDDQKQPVLLRKKNDESCALALVALRLTGSNLLVPPGAIVSVGRPSPKDVTGTVKVEDATRSHPTTTLHSIAFDPQKHPVLPLRLSAWAFPQAIDRALYAVDGYGLEINSERRDLVSKHTLDDYRHVAADLLQLCIDGGPRFVPAQPLRESLTATESQSTGSYAKF